MSKLEAGSSRGCCYQAASASSAADSVEAAASKEDKEAVDAATALDHRCCVLSSYNECPVKYVPKYFGLSLC